MSFSTVAAASASPPPRTWREATPSPRTASAKPSDHSFYPLEERARIAHAATLHLVGILAAKYSAASGRSTVRDLARSHQRQLSLDYVQSVAAHMGGDKQALAGTFSLLDEKAERLEPICIARAPEEGKARGSD